MKRYAIEIAVVVATFLVCLGMREAYHGYERANAAFAWAQEAHCRVFPEKCVTKPAPPAAKQGP